ncbi:MAG: hypothetical protein M0R17_07080 [Candidatus Omnitrophica bacterium]|jgi:hypothetical protein|nr:hypothetical protein [Candidatus Omnitrophota bacterium]
MKNPVTIGNSVPYDKREYTGIFTETELSIPSSWKGQKYFKYQQMYEMLDENDRKKLKSLQVGQGFAPTPESFVCHRQGYMSGWIRRVK